MKTNILYVTTKCNLDCDYCYERKKRNEENFTHKDATIEDVDKAYSNIDVNDSLVLIGGEPFLNFSVCEYALNKYFKYNFCLTTNGVILNRQFDKYYPKIKDVKNLHLQISYDGSGNSRRKFPNSSIDSTKDVLELLDKLSHHPIQGTISVSYTLHKLNVDKFTTDIITLIKSYKYLDNVILNISNEVEKEQYEDHVLALRSLIYGKLCCFHYCSTCHFCLGSISTHEKHYLTSNGMKQEIDMGLFNHWD
jgi:sulfatase maturation enzyme AslB (radical SAM superfamily)